MPLRTAIKIGGDEGFELAKATLCRKGFKLYSQVWNDQPPLHTFIVTQILRRVASSILAPRLVTVAFATLLLASLYGLAKNVQVARGVRWLPLPKRENPHLHSCVPVLAVALLIASPGFLTLTSSCMLEVPALAPAIAALWVLASISRKHPQVGTGGGTSRPHPLQVIAAGVLFGMSFEIKLINIVLLPLALLIIYSQRRGPNPGKSVFITFAILIAAALASVVALDFLCCRGAYLAHFQQAWSSHFTRTKSFEYGSPADFPYDWNVLLRNWDVTIPALAGFAVSISAARRRILAILPAAWLALNLAIFGFHKPWWSYYYVHTALPLCWCAAVGIGATIQLCLSVRRRLAWALPVVFGVLAVCWMSGRLYLQIKTARNSPQTFNSLVFTQISHYKPYVKWFYPYDPIYSFHASIPMPPDLAVIMLKRLWSGEMTNAKLAAELQQIQPGMILLQNTTRPVPFQNLIATKYRLAYEDPSMLLYVHESIAKK
jgi:hypothetical protein